MKRILIFLFCLLLILPCTATAGGLGGLGGLPVIETPKSADDGVLPDPADLLGSAGTLYAENYTFAPDFICTVYTYDLPGNNFLANYLEQAQANGFTATETTVEGYAAYRLENGGLAALLLPEYSGVMMLLVQNGITFGEPLPEYYLRMVYNGREVLTDKMDFMKSYDSYAYQFDYFDTEQIPGHMEMRFAKTLRAGDEYTWTPSSPPDYLSFYTDTDSFLLLYNNYLRQGEWGGSSDYFHLKIVTKEDTPSGLLVEGRFDAILNYAETTIENGSFRILIR